MKPLKIILYIAVSSVVIVGIIGLVYVCLFIAGFKEATTSVVDIAKYESILKEWKEFAPEMVNHFPEVIPPDARNTEFYFRPGFLQGSQTIELRYRATPEKIESLYEEFSKLKTHANQGGILLIHFPLGGGNADVTELGEDWVAMHFEECPDDSREHTKEYGVMISIESNEIIYWAEW